MFLITITFCKNIFSTKTNVKIASMMKDKASRNIIGVQYENSRRPTRCDYQLLILPTSHSPNPPANKESSLP